MKIICNLHAACADGNHCSEAEVEQLVAATEGFTGSDLAVLCREAAMAPLRELVAAGALHGLEGPGGAAVPPIRPVSYTDFAGAVHKTGPAATQRVGPG